MLQSISWGDYFFTLTFLVVVYYIAIAYLYFRNELLALAGITLHERDTLSINTLTDGTAKPQWEANERPQLNGSEDIDITPVVQAFINEAEAYLEQASADKTEKQDVLSALQRISARYPILASMDYRTGLAKDIHNLTSRYLPGAFTTAELKPYLFT